MYQIRNKVYSEAGYILVGLNKKGYQFEGQPSDFTEEKISLDNMKLNGEFVTYGNGIIQHIGSNPDYSKLKADMVKRRYSNDDQIAILLNGDDQIAILLNGDEDAMIRMQEWRNWSAEVSKKIIEVLNK